MIQESWQANGEGRLELFIEGEEKAVAFMDLLKTESGKLVIKHTEVAPEMTGKGYGKELLAYVVDYSRQHNLKILPVCPYAKNLMYRDLEAYRDVM